VGEVEVIAQAIDTHVTSHVITVVMHM